MATTLVGLLAIVCTISFAWPQAIRARRSTDISGVSAHTAMLLVFTAATWFLYGVATTDPAVIVANAASLVAVTLSAVTLHQRGGLGTRLALLTTAGWAAAIAVVAVAGAAIGWGAALIGAAGAALGIGMTVPQAWHAATGHGTAGVSLASYLLLLAMVASWFAYGLLESNPVLWFPNAVALVVVGTVVVVLLRSRPDAGVRVGAAGE